MNSSWMLVVAVGVSTLVMKNSGLWLKDRSRLPSWILATLPLLAPALLAAFVVGGLGCDERIVGLLVCSMLLWKEAPLWLVLTATAGSTALLRLLL